MLASQVIGAFWYLFSTGAGAKHARSTDMVLQSCTVMKTVQHLIRFWMCRVLLSNLMTFKIQQSSTLECSLTLSSLVWWDNQKIFHRNSFTAFGGVCETSDSWWVGS
uniref:Putative cyclic nucleotide-gated ion channel 13 n=1 Tax=Rhizophora mucronata TaxID=61149 RepID=A0A2P2LDB9_RHIMU